jgi:hypothetical protein
LSGSEIRGELGRTPSVNGLREWPADQPSADSLPLNPGYMLRSTSYELRSTAALQS